MLGVGVFGSAGHWSRPALSSRYMPYATAVAEDLSYATTVCTTTRDLEALARIDAIEL